MITIGQFNINRYLLTMFFNNSDIKNYMGIPSEDLNSIVTFRDKYFIQSVPGEAIVIDEKSRIYYRDTNMTETRNVMVKMNYLLFDIYVKTEDEYNVDSTNRLIRRQDKIWQKIIELINHQRIEGFQFRLCDKGDLYCAIRGYKRYFLKFEYKTIL